LLSANAVGAYLTTWAHVAATATINWVVVGIHALARTGCFTELAGSQAFSTATHLTACTSGPTTTAVDRVVVCVDALAIAANGIGACRLARAIDAVPACCTSAAAAATVRCIVLQIDTSIAT
jgi:hypothetical protein